MSRRPRVAGRSAPGPRRTTPLWPVAVAIAVRLIAWSVIPSTRFASDEESYFQVSTALLRGHQDLFWPPMTGWLLAALRYVLGTDSVGTLRLVWIAMDVGCVLGVRTLAARVGEAVWPADTARASRLALLATAGYALYLPAISHAQFVTSETPALLQVLGILVLLTRPGAGTAAFIGGGVLAGALALTRPSLLPLAVLLPLAAAWGRRPIDLRRAAVFVLVAATMVSAHAYRNWRFAGEATISTNSAYNFYLGNRDLYAEDLNLFAPRATPGQIEFRRQQWSGELVYPTQSPAELQRLAWAWIAGHPGTFVRRALGRLARVLVPKTDVLEMLGGERAAGVTSRPALALLLAVNGQWAVVLFGGVVGLFHLRRRSPELGVLLVTTIIGSLLLCLLAISKPRYSFVFDPVLLIGAAVVAMAPRAALLSLGTGERRVLGVIFAFIAWAWIAFAIFAITSRASL